MHPRLAPARRAAPFVLGMGIVLLLFGGLNAPMTRCEGGGIVEGQATQGVCALDVWWPGLVAVLVGLAFVAAAAAVMYRVPRPPRLHPDVPWRAALGAFLVGLTVLLAGLLMGTGTTCSASGSGEAACATTVEPWGYAAYAGGAILTVPAAAMLVRAVLVFARRARA